MKASTVLMVAVMIAGGLNFGQTKQPTSNITTGGVL
jgi:hypothetical protein